MIRPALLLALLLAPDASAQARLRLPLVLSDGAVVQRGEPVPVWGDARPGAAVTVRLGGARLVTAADASGRWSVSVPALPAGGPYVLDVASGSEHVRAADLLSGDIWVLSGQSNMQLRVDQANGAAERVAQASDRQIRHFKVPKTHAEAPVDTLQGGAWEVASPRTVGGFSAVGYEFALALREHVGVPIGLMNTSWGGSRIEPWMSASMLGVADADSVYQSVRDRNAAREAVLRERLGGAFPRGAPEPAEGEMPPQAAPDLDDAGWSTMRVPNRWESVGYDGLDGVAWFRTSFDVRDPSRDATVSLGRVNDGHHVYVNGVLVGQGTGGLDPWSYTVPAEALRSGRNVLAVRVSDPGGSGGIRGGDDLLFVEEAGGARHPLAGDWRFRVVEGHFGAESEINQVPMVLWNAMVNPLTPSPVAGVLWYQGESNASDADAYAGLFQALITGWRAAWRRPALPFLWVQLAGYQPPPRSPGNAGSWAALRAAQSAALALPRTAEALALDVGDADDIHPRDKRTVGRRLALAARALVYGETGLEHSGPRFRSCAREGAGVAVAFDHAGGLATRDGAAPGGFALSGADGRWHWARARIESGRVVVQSAAVARPHAVRYAWANNPTAATLTNAEALPAAPFQASVPD